MRLNKEELEQVKKKYSVNRLYSYSRLDCFNRSPFEYWLKYVARKEEDRADCIYAPVGNGCHDILERYYDNKIKYVDMSEEFEDVWIAYAKCYNFKFDRNDEEKNKSIGEKYYENLKHFFMNHKQIKSNVVLERFLAVKIGDYVLQGYADIIFKAPNGKIVIGDWKSSSKFSGQSLIDHSWQLVIYAMALIQLGVPLADIICAFNFLKYCSITYQQANGKVKTKSVERRNIGNSLKANAKMWLKKLGYENDVDFYLNTLEQTNSIECLPDEVKNKYAIFDCWVEIPLTQKLIDQCSKMVIHTIMDIEAREADYKRMQDEGANEFTLSKLFWDDTELIKQQSYYHATLSGYSKKLHKPYAEWLVMQEEKKAGNVLLDSREQEVACVGDEDWSWLDAI